MGRSRSRSNRSRKPASWASTFSSTDSCSNTSRFATADRAAHGVTAEGEPVRERGLALEEGLGEEVATDHRAERRVAAGEPLGAGDDVGEVVVALAAEHRAEPAERADDLVGHEQHAVAVADLADPLEVALGRDEATARVLHRFEEHRGDGVGALEDDALLELVGEREHERLLVVGERVATAVGVRHVAGAGGQRLEGRAQRGNTGDRERAQRGAVVRGAPGDHLVALSLADGAEVLTRELPRRLDRFGTASGEEHPVEVAGRERGEARRQLDRRWVRVRPHREVVERLRLDARRLGEIGTTVTDLHGEEARQPVEQLVPGRVPEPAPLTARDDVHRRVGPVPAEAGEVHPEVTVGERAELVGRPGSVAGLGHRVPHV